MAFTATFTPVTHKKDKSYESEIEIEKRYSEKVILRTSLFVLSKIDSSIAT